MSTVYALYTLAGTMGVLGLLIIGYIVRECLRK